MEAEKEVQEYEKELEQEMTAEEAGDEGVEGMDETRTPTDG